MIRKLLRSNLKWFSGITGVLALSLCMIFSGMAMGQGVQVVSAENIDSGVAEAGELLHYAPSEVNEKDREALNKIISVEFEKIPMEVALWDIANLAGLRVAYSKSKGVDKTQWQKPVSIQYDRVTVLGALYAALGDTGLRLTLSSTSGDGHLIVVEGSVKQMGQPNPDGVLLDNEAQETVTGRVTDSTTGESLPGVSVVVEGTTIGTSTDDEGYYSLAVSDDAALVFSYVGYEAVTIPVQGRAEVDVELVSEMVALDEAVVTAFGVQREHRSIGTAVGRVPGGDVAEVRDINVANNLAGRVAGVEVQSAGTGPGGSTRVIIRGNQSLAGNNQPLYVIDGVPLDNTNHSNAGRWGGEDSGDGIGDINPHDIEDISVLKGPNAAALYGERGANGVVLITTKSGRARDGIGVTVTSNVTFGSPWVDRPHQNQYGVGLGGTFDHYTDGSEVISRSEAENRGVLNTWTPINTTAGFASWGAPMDGREYYRWDGQLDTFDPQPNNFDDFFRTETRVENQIALTGGDERSQFRLSLNNLNNNGIMPNNDLERTNISFRGSSQLTDALNVEASVNYTEFTREAVPALSDRQNNVAYQYGLRAPRNISLESLTPWQITAEDLDNPLYAFDTSGGDKQLGFSRLWSSGTFIEQPYWSVEEWNDTFERQRLMGHVRGSYNLNEWAHLQVTVGTDTYTNSEFSFRNVGTRVDQAGRMSETIRRFQETNVEALLQTERTVTEDLTVSVNVGGNYLTNKLRNTNAQGRQLTVPGLYTPGNALDRRSGTSLREFEIQSLFAFGQFNFRDYLYLDWTVRNDWSSTLPPEDPSFLYPSFSGNFVWSDAFNLTTPVFSYGAVRGSWAQAGASADPYQLSGTFSLGLPQAGVPRSSFQGSIPFVDLKPELTTSIEVGTDLRFFEGRLRTDLTYYHSSTENQILSVGVPFSTGFSGRSMNAGEIKNQGFEAMVMATPVAIPGGLQWNMTFNFGLNRNEVVELVEGIDRFVMGQDRIALVTADPGQPYGEIISQAARWMRDGDGNLMIGPDGNPLRESGNFRVGNATPDWTGGISNHLSYRGFTLSSLIDISQGGSIASMSGIYSAINGVFEYSLEGRDGMLIEGVAAEQDAQGNWVSTGQPNTVETTAQSYWRDTATSGSENAVAEQFTTDASYIALRELSLGYAFPSLVERLPISQLRFSIVGRNLFHFEEHTSQWGFAPEEARFNVDQSHLGIEHASVPMTRTIGFNITVGI